MAATFSIFLKCMFEKPKIGKFLWEYACGQQFEKLVVTNRFLKKILVSSHTYKNHINFCHCGKTTRNRKNNDREFIIYSKAISCTKILRT